MVRILALVVVLVGTNGLWAQDEPVFGKKAPEWLAILQYQEPRAVLPASTVALAGLPGSGDPSPALAGLFPGRPTRNSVKYRRAAVLALEIFGARYRTGVEGLIAALENPEEAVEVRLQIAQTLGRMGPEAKGAAQALGFALKNDKAENVREAAARSLGGKLGEQAFTQVRALGDALKDPHEGTQLAAIETLKGFGDKAGPALPQILSLINEKKAGRFAMIHALHIVGRLAADQTSIDLVIVQLKDQGAHLSVREAAADALGRMGSNSPAISINALKTILQDKQVELRRIAAVSLTKFSATQFQSAWPEIKSSLQDSDIQVRSQAVRLAGRLGKTQPDVVKELTDIAVKDQNTEIRLASIQELGQLGTYAKAAVSDLQKIIATDGRASIREAAQVALKKIEAN